MRPMVVYLSGPISNGGTATPEQIADNVRASLGTHVELMRAGFAVINPILTAYVDEMHDIPWNTWITADLAILARCDAVLRLPGPSVGADQECAFAREKWIPVFVSIDDLVRYRDRMTFELLTPV